MKDKNSSTGFFKSCFYLLVLLAIYGNLANSMGLPGAEYFDRAYATATQYVQQFTHHEPERSSGKVDTTNESDYESASQDASSVEGEDNDYQAAYEAKAKAEAEAKAKAEAEAKAKAEAEAKAKKSYVRDGYTLIEFSGNEPQFFDKLSTELFAKNPKICIKNYSELTFTDLYRCAYGAFMVKDFSTSLRTVTDNGVEEVYQHVDFTFYDESVSEIQYMKQEIDAAAQQILSKARACEYGWNEVKVIHDELCTLITYDKSMSLPHTHDLYGALVLHRAVCSAYAGAFSFLVNQLGYGVSQIDSEEHSWNSANTGSSDCFMDVTWDDWDMYDKFGYPYIVYDHFFITESEMESVGEHTAVSFTNERIWGDAEKGFNYHAHEGYYLSSWDEATLEAVLHHQYTSASNCLTVRFQNDADYQKALAWAGDADYGLGPSLYKMGYREQYRYYTNDNLNIINICLYI